MVRVVGDEGSGRCPSLLLEAVSVGGLFCFDTSIRTDRRKSNADQLASRPSTSPPMIEQVPNGVVRRVSLILDFAWSVFSANRLSGCELGILPLRVIRLRPSPSSRRPQDE
jgi:hypothetical protein